MASSHNTAATMAQSSNTKPEQNVKFREEAHGSSKRRAGDEDEKLSKKKRKHKDKKARRQSISKAARDPRDEPDSSSAPPTPEIQTRSPSPVIDFDGLSKPSKYLVSTTM